MWWKKCRHEALKWHKVLVIGDSQKKSQKSAPYSATFLFRLDLYSQKVFIYQTIICNVYNTIVNFNNKTAVYLK